MRILIVEDNPSDYLMIAHIIEENDITLDWCRFANAALDKIKTYNYDAIILDFILPEFDGIELLKCIRHLKIETPVIFITGIANQDEIDRAIKEGAKCFFNKDFLLKEKNLLIQCLKEIDFKYSHKEESNAFLFSWMKST